MSLKRPRHLTRRQSRGRAFNEPLTIIYIRGTRNDYGEYAETRNEVRTYGATAPASRQDALVRTLLEGGIQLDALRLFWTAEDVDPVREGQGPGDIIVYEGTMYRVQNTQRWGGFSETMATREEGQDA